MALFDKLTRRQQDVYKFIREKIRGRSEDFPFAFRVKEIIDVVIPRPLQDISKFYRRGYFRNDGASALLGGFLRDFLETIEIQTELDRARGDNGNDLENAALNGFFNRVLKIFALKDGAI